MAKTKHVSDLRAVLDKSNESYPITKGFVARLLCNDKSVAFVAKKITEIYETQPANSNRHIHIKSLNCELYRFLKTLRKHKMNLTNHWKDIVEYYNGIFEIPISNYNMIQTPATKSTASECHLDPPLQVSTIVQSEIIPPPSASTTTRQFKKECPGCANNARTLLNMRQVVTTLERKLRLQKKEYNRSRTNEIRQCQYIRRLKNELRTLKFKYICAAPNRSFVSGMKTKLSDLKQQNKSINVQLRVCTGTIERMRQEITNVRCENVAVKAELAKLRQQMTVHVMTMETDFNKQMAAARKSESAKVSCLENEIEELREFANERDASSMDVKIDKKTYGWRLRKCIYKSLVCQVSVNRCSELIRYVGECLFERKLPVLPVKSTVAKMAYELGVLAAVKAGYILHRVPEVATIAWDATSLRGCHINEVHIETESEILVLSIEVLPGGTGKDYFHHVCDALLGVIRTYCDAYNLKEEEVKPVILGKILSCMTDRAKANHSAVLMLQKELAINWEELHCLIHTVEGLARAASGVMKKLDTEWNLHRLLRKPASSEPVVIDLLYSIAKLRYKQGTGDPVGFRHFLVRKGLKQRTIMRYVGHRMNALFSMAATVYTHRTVLMEYFSSCIRPQLKDAIIRQMRHPRVLLQLQALGLFGKLLTGPWMNLFYGNVGKNSHLQVAHEKFPTCMGNLNRLQHDPGLILVCTEDFFNRGLVLTDDITALRDVSSYVDFTKLVSMLAGSFISVMHSQLRPFLSGALPELSVQKQSDTASAPLSNMQAERTLGIVDALWRKAPGARCGFIDGKVRGAQSKVIEWVDSLSDPEQDNLAAFVIKAGSKLANESAAHTKRVEEEVCERQKVIAQKADEARRAALEKTLTFAITHGQPVQELQMFAHLDVEHRAVMEEAIADPNKLIGRMFTHLWNIDGFDRLYRERITRVKPHKGTAGNSVADQSFCLTFWEPEDPDSDRDFSMSVIKFLVDLSLGDVSLSLS